MQRGAGEMLIKGQKDFPCIFCLENVMLRVRAGSGGAWLDANSHTVAKYDSKERAGAVLNELYYAATNDLDAAGYRLPEK